MKSTGNSKAAANTQKQPKGIIHPIVIYPFRQQDGYADLEELYGLVAKLAASREVYARPITVMDRKTFNFKSSDKQFAAFRNDVVKKHSDILDTWSVDTCQMWYSGLGMAMDRGGPNDVYWLIPGDFNYGSGAGRDVLRQLHDLPEICFELDQDMCVGEIVADQANSKQLIDTYGTFALLYTWFPAEAQEIRQYTEKPRSEFFAIRHAFLQEMLNQRWYAYEQTVVMLLNAMFSKKRVTRFLVGNISDLPEGRESFASAIKQIERTERVLKNIWLERNEIKPVWKDQYRLLESKSSLVKRTAMVLLENLLT